MALVFHSNVTVGSGGAVIVPARVRRVKVELSNLGTVPVFLRFGANPALNVGWVLRPGQDRAFSIDDLEALAQGELRGIAPSNCLLAVTEVGE